MTIEQNRLGTVGIVVEEPSSVAEINAKGELVITYSDGTQKEVPF